MVGIYIYTKYIDLNVITRYIISIWLVDLFPLPSRHIYGILWPWMDSLHLVLTALALWRPEKCLPFQVSKHSSSGETHVKANRNLNKTLLILHFFGKTYTFFWVPSTTQPLFQVNSEPPAGVGRSSEDQRCGSSCRRLRRNELSNIR